MVYVNFLTSSIQFGFQIKSAGDIKAQKVRFQQSVLAQISESKRHGIDRLIIGFAADLTSKSNAQKVRGILSVIG